MVDNLYNLKFRRLIFQKRFCMGLLKNNRMQ